jgi:L-2-hydroxycarboxylate dehydrogenase (NAD+)
LRLAAQRGEAIPAGIALDSAGRPTTDGMAAFHGVTKPFGGAKGAAVSLMMKVFTGAAFGGNVGNLNNDFSRKQDVGHLMIVMRSDLFMSTDLFKQRMDELVVAMKSQPLAEGFSEILMVGEPESRSTAIRLVHGIPIQEDVVASLCEEAASYSCDLKFPSPI